MRKLEISVVLASLFVGSAVYAGAKWDYGNPSISRNADGSGWAETVLSSVRNSSDSISYVECDVYALPSYKGIYCAAWNGTTSLSCMTADPAMTAAASGLKGDSYLYFTVDNAGNCTALQTSHGSMYAPKAP